MTAPTTDPIRLGMRANLAQFSLLVAVNALVGGMIGQERTVLPLLAGQVFAVGAFTASLTFIVAFGVTKALTNLAAGTLSDRYGRKPVLVAGWLIGLPVPLLLIWAPSWWWIIAANLLLGINQGGRARGRSAAGGCREGDHGRVPPEVKAPVVPGPGRQDQVQPTRRG